MALQEEGWSRRQVLRGGGSLAAGLATRGLWGQAAGPQGVVEVASAGSLRASLEGPLGAAIAADLGLQLRVHAGGADGVARSLVDGSVAADVFLPVTAGPMRTVFAAGKAEAATPFASTEMVLLYSPKSRFSGQFAEAAQGKREWWRVLEEPGLRFARSNPLEDPSGRAAWFLMLLAEAKYGQPGLAERVLGAPLNPDQVQAGRDVRAALADGSVDASAGYRIATHGGALPFLMLPADVNLGDPHVRERHPELVLRIGDQQFRPEPLIFYAGVLLGARNLDGAARLVRWLASPRAADTLARLGFGTPAGAQPLVGDTQGV